MLISAFKTFKITTTSIKNFVPSSANFKKKNICSLPTQVLMTTKLLNSAMDPDF